MLLVLLLILVVLEMTARRRGKGRHLSLCHRVARRMGRYWKRPPNAGKWLGMKLGDSMHFSLDKRKGAVFALILVNCVLVAPIIDPGSPWDISAG